VFPVKVEGIDVFLLLPPADQLDALLATELHCVTSCQPAPDFLVSYEAPEMVSATL